MANLKMKAAIKEVKKITDGGGVAIQIHAENNAIWTYTIGLSKIAGHEIFCLLFTTPDHKLKMAQFIQSAMLNIVNLNKHMFERDKKPLDSPRMFRFFADRAWILIDPGQLSDMLNSNRQIYLFPLFNAIYPELNSMPAMQLIFSDLAGNYPWESRLVSNDIYAKSQVILLPSLLDQIVKLNFSDSNFIDLLISKGSIITAEVSRVNSSLGYRRDKKSSAGSHKAL
jgi:hypothetical protein